MFSFSEYLIKIYGSTHMARVAFLLFKKLCYRQYSKSFRPISLLYKWSELISGYFCGRRGMCAWRGVEDRERAWGWLIKVRRASDLPSKIFTPGKFYVPDRHTPEGGLVHKSEKFRENALEEKDRSSYDGREVAFRADYGCLGGVGRADYLVA